MCVSPPQGKAQNETLLRAEHTPLPLPCRHGSADGEEEEGGRDMCVRTCQAGVVVFAHNPRQVPS